MKQLNHSRLVNMVTDERMDNMGKRNVTLCLRFLHGNVTRENVLQFTEINEMTGRSIADMILIEPQTIEMYHS